MKHFSAALYVFMSIAIQAQSQSYEAKACQRKPAGNYLIEITQSVYDVEVAIYNNKDKILSGNGLTGYAGFYYPDGSYLKKELTSIPNTSSFTVKIPYAGFLTFRIIFIIDGKIIAAEFENVCTLKAPRP